MPTVKEYISGFFKILIILVGILLIRYPNFGSALRDTINVFFSKLFFQNNAHDFAGSAWPIYLNFLQSLLYGLIYGWNYPYPQFQLLLVKNWKQSKKWYTYFFRQSLFLKKSFELFCRIWHCDIILDYKFFVFGFRLLGVLKSWVWSRAKFFRTPTSSAVYFWNFWLFDFFLFLFFVF